MKVPVQLLTRMVYTRLPVEPIDKFYSIVSVATCNEHCPYCLAGGELRDSNGLFPGMTERPIEEIEAFIAEQVADGNPVQISGGEPAIWPDLVLRLLEFTRKCGGYSRVDTNGSAPSVIQQFADIADLISMDFKGYADFGIELTGASRKLARDNPIEVLKMSAGFQCHLETKFVIFEKTRHEDIEDLVAFIPPKGYLTLKRFVPEYYVADGTRALTTSHPYMTQPSIDQMLGLRGALLRKYPGIDGRLTLVTDWADKPEAIVLSEQEHAP